MSIRETETWHLAPKEKLTRSDFLLPNDAAHFHDPTKHKPRAEPIVNNSTTGPRIYPQKRVRDTPTFHSTLFEQRDYNRYDVRDGVYHADPPTEHSVAGSQSTAFKPSPARSAKKMNCHPFPAEPPLPSKIPQKPYQPQSQTARAFKKPGYDNYVPRDAGEMGAIKIGEPGAYWGPKPRHLPNPYTYETPNDFTVTLEVKNVDKKADTGVLRRDLANRGLDWMEGQFYHNPITNKRSGNGVVHVRCKTAQEIDGVKRRLQESGIDATVKGGYKPVWKKY